MNVRSLLLVVIAATVLGCERSPESFRVTSGLSPSVASADGQDIRSLALVEGDVTVVRAAPLDDDDDEMNLCVTATSSAPSVVEVRRVRKQCRSFVVMAKSSGTATITFEARDGSEPITVSVRPLP